MVMCMFYQGAVKYCPAHLWGVWERYTQIFSFIPLYWESSLTCAIFIEEIALIYLLPREAEFDDI